MNVLISGQKWFGSEVFKSISDLENVCVVAVVSPVGDGSQDRLTFAAEMKGVRVIPAGTLTAASMPKGVDLIVAAHSFDFISEKARNRSTFGGIGYHPSLLPLHRGRDSVKWAIRMGERVTGGTVYRLSNRMDGGNILAQRHVFVRPGDTAEELWRRDLAPLGAELIRRVVLEISEKGHVEGEPQDDSLATWEPSIGRAPAFRPDVMQIAERSEL